MRPNLTRKPRINRRLPRNITRPHFLDDRPANDIIHILLPQCRLCHESLKSESLEIDGHLICVDGGGLCEGEADSVDNDNIGFFVGCFGGGEGGDSGWKGFGSDRQGFGGEGGGWNGSK